MEERGFRPHHHHCALAFIWLDFLCREGGREGRIKKVYKKNRKEGVPSVFPPPVAGDLQYSCTPKESKADKEEERFLEGEVSR